MIYLDNAATTPLHPSARAAMLPHLAEVFANPSGVYNPARKVRKAIDEARQTVANAISATPAEIYFTSGGTESCNWAIKGVAEANQKCKHIITSSIEHPAIINTCKYLESKGYEITYLPVCESGFVDPKAIEFSIRPNTCLVSITHANHEVGTIQPISEISKITRKHGVPLHTDAIQTVGKLKIDVDALGVDLLSLSAHKFYGPKGIGALYIRKGTSITSLIHGGSHERNRRAGTENVIGIIGMATALDTVVAEMPKEQVRLTALRNKIIHEILNTIPHTHLNGTNCKNRLSTNVNISFRFIEGESLLLHLDMHGCYASTGSACTSGALEPSHVLLALGLSHELANGAIRFTLGRESTNEDIDKLLEILPPIIQKLRDLSPLYDDYMSQKTK